MIIAAIMEVKKPANIAINIERYTSEFVVCADISEKKTINKIITNNIKKPKTLKKK